MLQSQEQLYPRKFPRYIISGDIESLKRNKLSLSGERSQLIFVEVWSFVAYIVTCIKHAFCKQTIIFTFPGHTPVSFSFNYVLLFVYSSTPKWTAPLIFSISFPPEPCATMSLRAAVSKGIISLCHPSSISCRRRP